MVGPEKTPKHRGGLDSIERKFLSLAGMGWPCGMSLFSGIEEVLAGPSAILRG